MRDDQEPSRNRVQRRNGHGRFDAVAIRRNHHVVQHAIAQRHGLAKGQFHQSIAVLLDQRVPHLLPRQRRHGKDPVGHSGRRQFEQLFVRKRIVFVVDARVQADEGQRLLRHDASAAFRRAKVEPLALQSRHAAAGQLGLDEQVQRLAHQRGGLADIGGVDVDIALDEGYVQLAGGKQLERLLRAAGASHVDLQTVLRGFLAQHQGKFVAMREHAARRHSERVLGRTALLIRK